MSHGRDSSPKPYGVVAEFKNPDDLVAAATAARDAGYSKMDGYSPVPVHGLVDVVGGKDDRLGFLVFGAGLTGALVGLGLQYWVSVEAYPHNAGGKPLFSLPAFVPVTFECTILLAALTAAGAMLFLNGLPRPHDPVLNAEAMSRVTSDAYCLCIEASDPNYDEQKVVDFFNSLNPVSVEAVMTSEGY